MFSDSSLRSQRFLYLLALCSCLRAIHIPRIDGTGPLVDWPRLPSRHGGERDGGREWEAVTWHLLLRASKEKVSFVLNAQFAFCLDAEEPDRELEKIAAFSVPVHPRSFLCLQTSVV